MYIKEARNWSAFRCDRCDKDNGPQLAIVIFEPFNYGRPAWRVGGVVCLPCANYLNHIPAVQGLTPEPVAPQIIIHYDNLRQTYLIGPQRLDIKLYITEGKVWGGSPAPSLPGVPELPLKWLGDWILCSEEELPIFLAAFERQDWLVHNMRMVLLGEENAGLSPEPAPSAN